MLGLCQISSGLSQVCTNEAGSRGESDLLTFIAHMSPSLDDQVWAFVSVGKVSSECIAEHALATFRN